MPSPRYFALIPAAGVGARLQAACPKQYLPLAGKPMLLHAIAALSAVPALTHVFVVVGADDGHAAAALSEIARPGGKVSLLREGGATRRESVLNGLRALEERIDAQDWILVHDAARPGLTSELVEKLMRALRDDPVGGLLALPLADTVKRADGDGRVQATVARDGLWSAQTPQMFRYGLLRQALEQAGQVTDEAGAVEALGLRPKLVEGSSRNFKVTLPQDVALAESYLRESE